MKLSIHLKNKKNVKMELDITESEAMEIFGIPSLKDTYIDQDGLVELHSPNGTIIYTDLMA